MTAHEYIHALESKKDIPDEMKCTRQWLISLIIDVWGKGYDEGTEAGKRQVHSRASDVDNFNNLFPWVKK